MKPRITAAKRDSVHVLAKNEARQQRHHSGVVNSSAKTFREGICVIARTR